MDERVTIGVPVYRGEEFLVEALESIRAQTHRDFEVHLSLDGADPACETICRSYLSDARFRLTIQPERLGWVGNLNWLMAQAKTPFWYFHQQDDLIAPTYLEALLAHARDNPSAALVYCDLQPMGRINAPFPQPPPVLGVSAFTRVLTMLREHFPAFAFRGLTRLAAVQGVGGIPTNDVTNFGVDISWLTGVARSGELHHVPSGLYWKRYHESNTESKWWAWEKAMRLQAWSVHCVSMLEQALQVSATVQARRLLWLAGIERLTSPYGAAHFLRIADLTNEDRMLLFDEMLAAARVSQRLDFATVLDASWEEIASWSRGFYWLPPVDSIEIESFGPQPIQAGVPFNVQPNGRSAFWVILARPVDPGLRLRLGDRILETHVDERVLTAFVPDELTATAGALPLVAVGRWDELRSSEVDFVVQPRS